MSVLQPPSSSSVGDVARDFQMLKQQSGTHVLPRRPLSTTYEVVPLPTNDLFKIPLPLSGLAPLGSSAGDGQDGRTKSESNLDDEDDLGKASRLGYSVDDKQMKVSRKIKDAKGHARTLSLGSMRGSGRIRDKDREREKEKEKEREKDKEKEKLDGEERSGKRGLWNSSNRRRGTTIATPGANSVSTSELRRIKKEERRKEKKERKEKEKEEKEKKVREKEEKEKERESRKIEKKKRKEEKRRYRRSTDLVALERRKEEKESRKKNRKTRSKGFGLTLEQAMEAQRDQYPDAKLPVTITFLADAIVRSGGLKKQGIFRFVRFRIHSNLYNYYNIST
jgi:hypothetical protein